jgi:hypothetical protein
MSVSPPGQKERKARDLNPHGLSAARFSKPARQPVSGYPPYRVDPAGVEPALPARQAGVVPLDHRPMQSREWGSNPRSPAPKAGGLPLSYPLHEGTAGESHRLATAASSCWTSSPKQVRPGVEPGLPRLPGWRAATTLPDRPVAEAGFEPAWERLMRPCWEPGSSPLRSTPGRTRTCARLHVREVPWPLGYGGRRQ